MEYKDRGKTNKQTSMHFGRHLTAFLMNITVNYIIYPEIKLNNWTTHLWISNGSFNFSCFYCDLLLPQCDPVSPQYLSICVYLKYRDLAGEKTDTTCSLSNYFQTEHVKHINIGCSLMSTIKMIIKISIRPCMAWDTFPATVSLMGHPI